MPIEQVSPGLERIIDLDQEVERLASGFGGDGTAMGLPWWPAEGPVWFQEGGYLLFSDIGQNRRMRYNDADGLSLFQTGTNEANGLTRDPQGRLLACEHDARRVTRQEADGSITVVADNYQGKRLNRPNDSGCEIRRHHLLHRSIPRHLPRHAVGIRRRLSSVARPR